MIQEIYLMRHAHVAYDTELSDRYKVPQYKEHLTPLGWAQSLELDYLLGESQLVFDSIYSSDYCRTIETITPYSIRTKMGIIENKLLREVKMKGESKLFLESSRLDQDFKNPAGESFNEGAARLDNVLQSIVKKDDHNVIVMTHGILIESFIKKHFDQFLKTNWPDVIKLTIIDGKYIKYDRVQNLIPNNFSDNSKLNYYPVFISENA